MQSEHFETLIDNISHLSRDELNEAAFAIKERRNYLAAADLEGFRVYDKVKWTHGSGLDKTEYTGTISKINRNK